MDRPFPIAKRYQPRSEKLIHWPLLVLLILIVLFSLVTSALETNVIASHNSLRIWFFDIGQGDATLIITPTGKRVLIDGGRDNAILAKLGSVFPPWDRRIDAIILTHPDGDHAIGLVSVVEQYNVGKVYLDRCEDSDFNRRMIEEAAKKKNIPVEEIFAGQKISEFTLEHRVIWPEKCGKEPNANSVVVLLYYLDKEILLTGMCSKLGITAVFLHQEMVF